MGECTNNLLLRIVFKIILEIKVLTGNHTIIRHRMIVKLMLHLGAQRTLSIYHLSI